MAKPAVVLLSGGLDSATVLAIAKAEGFAAHALSVRYGQRHAIEIARAGALVRALGAAGHAVVDVDLRVIAPSALTGGGAVPKGRGAGEIGQGIPATYVPARNTIFLSFALAWAETLGARDIFIGANALDYSGYPDCRPDYLAAFERLANLATKAGAEGRRFSIHAPLIAMTKAEIVRRGVALGVDYAMTTSCYDPGANGRPCGACDSCALRAKGFAEAGIKDPLLAKFGRA
ncbi:MAG: 7-cyano-7-deazaguanine synthase QueC [Rhodospirillales bacterium]|nr:7-cyano-7-deazaguanine synthase QueC [Rhodospirillales bacterium]